MIKFAKVKRQFYPAFNFSFTLWSLVAIWFAPTWTFEGGGVGQSREATSHSHIILTSSPNRQIISECQIILTLFSKPTSPSHVKMIRSISLKASECCSDLKSYPHIHHHFHCQKCEDFKLGLGLKALWASWLCPKLFLDDENSTRPFPLDIFRDSSFWTLPFVM